MYLYFKNTIRLKVKECLDVNEFKHPKVHISLGLVFAVSHLTTHRQEGENVGEE